jgi:F-type H+-transporting ATPase subunit delta
LSRLVARRYAKALLEIGAKAGALDQLQSELDRLGAMMAQSPDLQRLLASPMALPKKKAEVMEAILKQAGASVTMQRFVKVVAEAGRLAILPILAEVFHDLVDQKNGVVVAKVTSAQALSDAQQASLKSSLGARTGKTVRLTLAQDPSLLGGLKVQVGSTVYDASLSGRLAILKQQLLTA